MGIKVPKESDLVAQALQLVALRFPGAVVWRQNAGAIAGEHKGKRRFVRFASIPGISDILACLPPDGRMLAVECKAPAGRIRPEQQAFLRSVRDAGGLSLLVRDLESLDRILAALKDGVRCCLECGCTDDDLRCLADRNGQPCSWAETYLCSACCKERAS